MCVDSKRIDTCSSEKSGMPKQKKKNRWRCSNAVSQKVILIGIKNKTKQKQKQRNKQTNKQTA